MKRTAQDIMKEALETGKITPDADLIAAAPLMLEALWAADTAFSTISSEWCARERELIRIAIAKATGDDNNA